MALSGKAWQEIKTALTEPGPVTGMHPAMALLRFRDGSTVAVPAFCEVSRSLVAKAMADMDTSIMLHVCDLDALKSHERLLVVMLANIAGVRLEV